MSRSGTGKFTFPPGKKFNTFYLFVFLFLFLSLGLFHRNQQAISLDATHLLASFRENDSLATATYLHQSLEVRGVIARATSKDHQMTLLLKTREAHHYIHCEMRETQVELINELIPGMTITVKGKCRWDNDRIILAKCLLITP